MFLRAALLLSLPIGLIACLPAVEASSPFWSSITLVLTTLFVLSGYGSSTIQPSTNVETPPDTPEEPKGYWGFSCTASGLTQKHFCPEDMSFNFMPFTDCGNGRCATEAGQQAQCPPDSEEACIAKGSPWMPVCIDGRKTHHCVSFPTHFGGPSESVYPPIAFTDFGEDRCVVGRGPSIVCPTNP